MEITANSLRWSIVLGEHLDEYLPRERELAETFKVSRATLREALNFLRAEGFVDSVPGVGWRAAKTLDGVSFDVIGRLFEDLGTEHRAAAVQLLLDIRTQQVVGAVATLVRARAPASRQIRSALNDLEGAIYSQQETSKALAMEDEFLTAVSGDDAKMPMRIAAHQTQRALRVVRHWLDPDGYLRPMAAIARALVDAIDTHDPRALELAFGAATLRNPLYQALAAQRSACCQDGNSAPDRAVGECPTSP